MPVDIEKLRACIGDVEPAMFGVKLQRELLAALDELEAARKMEEAWASTADDNQLRDELVVERRKVWDAVTERNEACVRTGEVVDERDAAVAKLANLKSEQEVLRETWLAELERDTAVAELEALRRQLPEGMGHHTIQFEECPVGHGRLTAANWVPSGCEKCEVDRVNILNREQAALLCSAIADRDAAIADRDALRPLLRLTYKLQLERVLADASTLRAELGECKRERDALRAETSGTGWLQKRMQSPDFRDAFAIEIAKDEAYQRAMKVVNAVGIAIPGFCADDDNAGALADVFFEFERESLRGDVKP